MIPAHLLGKKRFLVVRPDRLGDVLLSLPVLRALKQGFPEAQVTFAIRSIYHALFQHPQAFGSQQLIERCFGVEGPFPSGCWDVAIVLQGNFPIVFALWKSKIPIRIGPLGSWFSFLLYSHGFRQRRSQVEKHEAQYNLDLLKTLGLSANDMFESPSLWVSGQVQQLARQWLFKHGWDGHSRLIVIHPGMGGSALNAPVSFYESLAKKVVSWGKGHSVQLLVTLGPADQAWREALCQTLGAPGTAWLLFDHSEPGAPQGIDFLAGLFEAAHLVLAPSTGPLHLAVALGKPILGIYPPIRVQSRFRWGPYQDPQKGQAVVLTPDVECPETFHCLGKACPHYFCMERLDATVAFECIQHHLEKGRFLSHEIRRRYSS